MSGLRSAGKGGSQAVPKRSKVESERQAEVQPPTTMPTAKASTQTSATTSKNRLRRCGARS